MVASFFEGLIAAAFRVINRWRVWYRLPLPIAVVNLLSLRVDLRWRNLFDTETAPPDPPIPPDFDIRRCRTADGTFNDLSKTWMGMADARFGRNAPLPQTYGEQPPSLYDPNPRVVSRELLARRDFVPATTVNVLLAAWLQFMVHDWLSHGVNDTQSPPWRFPVPEGDDWPQKDMTILRTCPDHQRGPKDEGRPAAYRNMVTHWWDGSQMYGSDLPTQHCVRSTPTGVLLPSGKLYLDDTGHLPVDPKAADDDPEQELAAINGNWWIGLSTMHTLFTREHNAIVDRLHLEYPNKDGEWLFQKARLINAALIVKIHATEWSHALLQSPTLQYAMRGEWWGALGEAYFKAFGRPSHNELLAGIPTSPADQYAAPFAITEEFTAVYRLHSLVPDDFSFRRHDDRGGDVVLHLHFGGGMKIFAQAKHPPGTVRVITHAQEIGHELTAIAFQLIARRPVDDIDVKMFPPCVAPDRFVKSFYDKNQFEDVLRNRVEPVVEFVRVIPVRRRE